MVIVQMLVLSQEIHLNYLRIRLLQLKKLVIDMHMKKKQIRFTDFSQMQRKQNGTGVVQKIKEKIL